MHIETKYLGEVQINEADIITFEQGLPGFEQYKKFILLALDPDLPMALLQSIEESMISFVVALPFAFKTDYMFDLSNEDINELQVKDPEDVISYAVVTLKESFNESTLNLLAPIVINNVKKLGKQIVLQDSKMYPLNYPFTMTTVASAE